MDHQRVRVALEGSGKRLTPTILFGDSITSAYGGWYGYANRASGFPTYLLRNAGVPGDTTADMLARVTTAVTAYSPALVVVLGGTNDTGTPEDTASNLTAIYNAISGAGGKIVACTIPPNDWTPDADLAERNAWIRANYSSFPRTFLCDWTNQLSVGGDGVTPVPGYFVDNTHPNDAGQQVMGSVLASVLAAAAAA